MAIPENRLSTIPVNAEYIDPEGRRRLGYITDWEGGPRGIADTSGGMNFQAWELEYDGNNLILKPELEGSNVIARTGIVGATQVSFAFDQNAQPSFVWIIDGIAYFNWYDSVATEYVTDILNDTISAVLSLDDKRDSQIENNDLILWYTKETDPAPIYTLYHAQQRERFTIQYEDKVNVPPYIASAGMHKGLRGKVQLSYTKPAE